MYPHRIYLHRPGEDYGSTFAPPRWTTTLRGDDHLVCRRTFRWPTALLPFERLWLSFSLNHPFELMLNGEPLGHHADPWLPFSIDLTSRVQPTNVLEFIKPLFAPNFIPGPIYLEVRRDVHLTEIIGETLWDDDLPRLRLTARVHGASPRPLSLVLRLDEQEILYQNLAATESLDIVTPPLTVRRWQSNQHNTMHQFDCQLLDPACVLSQHAYRTGFRHVERLGAEQFRINGVLHTLKPYPWNEPLDESATLTAADLAGELLVLTPPTPAALPYLWHHPSVLLAPTLASE